VAKAIVQEIRTQVTPEESARMAGARGVLPAAHEEYLLGRYHFWQGSGSDYKQAIDHYERAVQIQPDYAAAHAGLSLAWHVSEAAGFSIPTAAREPARAGARKALELDPNLPEALSAMAAVQWFQDWDWAGAERSYRRAADLDPNSLDVCGCYIVFLFMMGRSAEAIAMADHFTSIDPLNPAAQSIYGGALHFAGKDDAAISHLQRSLELDALYYLGARELAHIYQELGRPQDAVTVIDRPEFRSLAAVGELYARLGRRADAMKIAEGPTAASDPQGVALIYFALGDKDRGFAWLTRALDERQAFINGIAFDPAFKGVRSDPRFQALVKRLKLPK